MSRHSVGAAVLALALAVAAGLSCSSPRDPMGPQGGALHVTLTAPGGNSDGAILFTLTGPEQPSSAVAGPGMRVFYQTLGATTRLVVTGTLSNSATVLTIQVADLTQAFSGAVEQVAATDYQLRASLTGYSLSVGP